MSPFLGEFLGTMILIVFGVGVVGGVLLKWSKSEDAGWIVITLGWGLGVSMGVYVSGTVSEGHINPAVTLALAVIGEFPWKEVIPYIVAQLLGAIVGACIVYVNYLRHWRETDDEATKLGVFATAPGTSVRVRHRYSNVVSEIIGTFVLLFALLFLIGPTDFAEGLTPLVVGALVVAIGLSLGGATGYAINPARDLGPRIAHAFLPITGKGGSDWSYSFVPVIGPLVGGTYGALFYQAVMHQQFSVAFWIGTVIIAALLVSTVILELNDRHFVKENEENEENEAV